MKQVKQLLRYPVVLVFFLFLFGYTLFDLTQTDREYSEFENKYLAQKPPFTMKAFLNNEWTQDYEEYINDQFVLRDDWITLKSVCESMLLKIENNGIAYGEDGYMFEKFTTLSGDQRAQYDRNLGYAMTFLNNHQNDNVTFAIIPNAYARHRRAPGLWTSPGRSPSTRTSISTTAPTITGPHWAPIMPMPS